MAHDHDHDVVDDEFEYEDVDIKDALGLPDALPPIRLLPLPELAAQARTAPVARQLAALAEWVGKEGREVDEVGDLTAEGLTAATAALGVDAADFAFLWECALGVEWLVLVVGETLEFYGPEADAEQADEDDEPEFDFAGQGMALAILLFLA